MISGRSGLTGGTSTRPSASGATKYERADPYSLSDDARLRERAALSFVTVFFSLVFAIPMICVGIILRFQ